MHSANVPLRAVAFDGQCRELSFGMHIVGVCSFRLSRKGFLVILLYHEFAPAILQIVITDISDLAGIGYGARRDLAVGAEVGWGFISESSPDRLSGLPGFQNTGKIHFGR